RVPRAAIAGQRSAGDRGAGRPLRLPAGRGHGRLLRSLGGRPAHESPVGAALAPRPHRDHIAAQAPLLQWAGHTTGRLPMRLHSDSFENRGPIPPEFALGAPGGFGGNRNPHLAWAEPPPGTRSFALLCIDSDAPTDASMAGRDDVEIPVEQPRTDFVHWAMVDIPADVREIAAGSCSDGVSKGGKRAPHGPDGSRQGLNDYTGWFAGDTGGMKGDYYGYDGPHPPPNDLRTHRYFCRLCAHGTDRPPLEAGFTATDVLRAMHGHVLAETAIHGTYPLHPSNL